MGPIFLRLENAKMGGLPLHTGQQPLPLQLWVAMGQRSKQNHLEYLVLHSFLCIRTIPILQ